MIVSADIASILVRDARRLGITEIDGTGSIPEGVLTTERIGITVQPLREEPYWNIAEAELNLYIPDLDGAADTVRLTQLERAACELFDAPYAHYDNTPYRYAIASSGLKADTLRACHFININITFKVLNVKN